MENERPRPCGFQNKSANRDPNDAGYGTKRVGDTHELTCMVRGNVHVVDSKTARHKSTQRIANTHHSDGKPGNLDFTYDKQGCGDPAESDRLADLAYSRDSHTRLHHTICNMPGNIQEHKRREMWRHAYQTGVSKINTQTLSDKSGQPRKQDIQRPVVAEVGNDDGPYGLGFEKFEDRGLGIFIRISGWKSAGNLFGFLGTDAWVRSRVLCRDEIPDNVPNSTHRAENVKDPLAICRNAIEKSFSMNNDVIIIDTAGRLHIDDQMMEEVKSIANEHNPDEILFVVDGMTGQDAVKSATAFDKMLPLSGVVLTKMDGDTRGGAAVSIMEVTGVPIKFIGNSESLEGIELFDPNRIADRILGFGDIISLVEKAQKTFDDENIEEMNNRLSAGKFDLNDFNVQLRQLKKMGSMNQILGLMPGMDSKIMKQLTMDDRQLNWTEAIINSMTLNERKKPENINGSRRLRISKGSGRSVQEVNALLKQFYQLKKMMKKMKNYNKFKLPGMADFGKF